MRKPLLILALAGEVFFGGMLYAQDEAPWKIKATGPDGMVKYNLETGIGVGTGGVRATYKPGTPDATEVMAQNATLNAKTGDITAVGNVVLRRDGTVWRAERMEYNFRTKNVSSAQFRSGGVTYFLRGGSMKGDDGKGVYRAKDVLFTTDDVEDPSMFIKAKEVTVAPGDFVAFKHATLHLGKLPVFYLPYYKRSLKPHPWNIHVKPGFKSEWGAYSLNAIRWPGNENYQGEFNLDYRTMRGWGLGPKIQYGSAKYGEGNFNLYRAYDDDPLTDSRGLAIDRERDLAQWSHRYFRDGFSTTMVLEYESDEYMRRDFYEGMYRSHVQPNTFLEVAQNWQDYHLSVLASPRVNSFHEHIDRLPDVQFSGTRHRLGESPVYYDTETSVGYLHRRYDYASSSEDYSLMRADTLHQLYLPSTYDGWLNITPRIGGRFTHYGDANGAGSTRDSRERHVFSTGVEMSTKISKYFPQAKSQIFDVNGLRHIVQPTINYAFIPRPNRVPSELDQFDYEVTSPRLLPLELPEYNAIDNIDSQNVFRLGLRNRLQTQRGGTVDNLADWSLYTDWRADPNSSQTTFADGFSDFSLKPRTWMSLNSRLRYDLDNSLWRTIDHNFRITPKQRRWAINGGHYYYLEQPKISKSDRTSVMYGGFDYRLNENWSFSTRQYYDAKRGQISSHDYIIQRDMRSWVFFIDLGFREGTGRRNQEMAISFNYSLKFTPREPSGN